jgi:NAD(P)-dependent dehydrogenase (short-subunit alcohol dehydrogenase family)
MDVKNKRVVVTGAASGIGKALCEAFHHARSSISYCGRYES